ncbi:hypothetical protein HPB50_008181 [Hyalomma asiaticum]|uniref:Uncharacterized protein n=1 Tax=Hyalomma asiaticum TaxID=266040 RepID=A0ACB7RT08_HYAAI|nr:hypothetical protein HPB50_008181 [Hyalomma asiaticum]
MSTINACPLESQMSGARMIAILFVITAVKLTTCIVNVDTNALGFVEPCHVEPQLLGHPALQPAAESVPGPDAGNTVPLAKRRFSVAAAGDLSTILECSKEGKSSSNSGGSSCSSSSSQHLPGGATLSSLARPPTGGTSNLPVLQEEPDGHEELRCSILSSWQLQETNETQLFESTDKRPVLKADALITVGDHQMKVLHHLASGAYARVYLAEVADSEETYLDDDESFQVPSQMKVVLKADNSSTSACWEAYICCELRQRLHETLGTTMEDGTHQSSSVMLVMKLRSSF